MVDCCWAGSIQICDIYLCPSADLYLALIRAYVMSFLLSSRIWMVKNCHWRGFHCLYSLNMILYPYSSSAVTVCSDVHHMAAAFDAAWNYVHPFSHTIPKSCGLPPPYCCHLMVMARRIKSYTRSIISLILHRTKKTSQGNLHSSIVNYKVERNEPKFKAQNCHKTPTTLVRIAISCITRD